ncbi:M28 family metallopeptidase [Saccharicrinis aurantiacus]|uniref:M28 family metallopeptidase n=1 Tax=Saccharicrinis aurantiacus TaxID=1849719 RepID=UPI0024909215|nr:M20/M25/M40 family metallo-hydrolase [Saccharicrinis aurantiacus]
MRNLMIISLLLIALNSEGQNTNVDTLKKHIEYLTSIELNGRISGTPEGYKAAEYIADQFRQNDISPYTDSTEYFQFFEKEYTTHKPSYLIKDNDTSEIYNINKHEFLLNESEFLISKDADQDSTLFYPIEVAKMEQAFEEAVALKEKEGIHNFIFLLKDSKKKGVRVKMKNLNATNKYHEAKICYKYGSSEYMRDKEEFNALKERINGLNIYLANKDFIANKTSFSISEEPDSVYTKQYQNVIGTMKGSNPNLKPLIICAHYDHIDSLYSRKTKVAAETDYYPGADDNASGTTAVIEIAKNLKSNKILPKQDIYFCLFDAEEIGLVGSEYLAEQLDENVDFVINADMIGRDKKNKKKNKNLILAISKGEKGRAFDKSYKKYLKDSKSSLKLQNNGISFTRLIFRIASDQASFAKKANFTIFTTGLHPDYHTHNDTADKINYEKLNEFVNTLSAYLSNNL